MKILVDFQGRPVRLTDERRQHILEHPEMAGMESALADTLRDPQLVIRSRTDETATLNYRYYLHTLVGGKWLCVVVKYSDGAEKGSELFSSGSGSKAGRSVE